MRTKQLFLIILLQTLFAISIQAEEFRVQENLHFNSTLLNTAIGYSIVLPSDYYISGKSYPVIYFLHGVGDNEASWLEYGQIAQYMDRMVRDNIISPFICVMPQGYRSYYSNSYTGDFPYQDMFVKELIPFIDHNYRTYATADKRGIMGYSMGGFGALVLPVKYPDLFHVSIPLSASIRTDKQYMDEEQKGWDQQWGKIFGGENKTGIDRLTDYYKQNSPYHLILNKKVEDLKKIAFFIENGDKENTLCRSNEELHLLMVEKKIPHIYNVRDGAHDFKFWCESIPEAFRFADCEFNNKQYLEVDTFKYTINKSEQQFWEEDVSLPGGNFNVFYPENQQVVHRSYPTVYFVSQLSENEQKQLICLYQQEIQKGMAAPMLFCFLPSKLDNAFFNRAIQYMEKNKPAREGRRFRAIWSYRKGGANVLEQALIQDKFTACIFTDSEILIESQMLEKLITDHESTRNNLRLYVDTPPDGISYPANGFLHINLREHSFTHEYRVRHKYKDDFSFLKSGFPLVVNFVSKRFHN